MGLVIDVEDVFPSGKYLGDGLGVEKLYGLYYSYDDVTEEDAKAHSEIDDALRTECERLASSD